MGSHANETDAAKFVPQNAPIEETAEPRVRDANRFKRDLGNFEERDFHLDELEYRRDGTNPGKLIIFNQEFFDALPGRKKLPSRRGTGRDVNEITFSFQRLGYNISIDDIHRDLTVEEILKTIDSVLEDKETLEKSNSLIIFFLSHGGEKNELHARDGVLNCSDIWTKFNYCKLLENKPKMFIFQACKGTYYTTTDGSVFNPVDDDLSSKLIDIDTFTVNQLGTDMLLLHSTIEGNVSFRNPATGTWFIQELCRNFSSYGRRDDVITLITRTIKCVCGNYYNYDEDKSTEYQKQMPIFVSTLSKKFYLNRNKDRHFLLEITNKLDEMYELLNTLVARE